MDGSSYVPGAESASHATRLALTVDRDAIGLMKHASQLGHLAEWWLQSTAATMPPLAALRLGRKLERLRLAARLAEGKSSRQVHTALDALRQEFALHDPPKEILAELGSAARESTRLAAAGKPPPTVFREAFGANSELPVAPPDVPKPGSSSTLLRVLLLLVAGGAVAAYLRPDLVDILMAHLPLP